jgi:hypothetical protein
MRLTSLFEAIEDPTYKDQMSLPRNGIMFQTSRGSRYVWDPSTKNTTRWKSFHPEHGASQKAGSQDVSEKTIFIPSETGFEFADVLGWVHEKSFIFYTTKSKIYLVGKDGTLSDPIAFSWRPRPGMYPLEFWEITKRPDKYKTARIVHLGNEIGRMSDAPF